MAAYTWVRPYGDFVQGLITSRPCKYCPGYPAAKQRSLLKKLVISLKTGFKKICIDLFNQNRDANRKRLKLLLGVGLDHAL